MKRFLAPILLMVFLLPSLALGLELDDLVEREGLSYEKFTVVPFTGEVTGKIQGQFKDGNLEGLWVSYRENGTVDDVLTGTFKNGMKVE
jgi:hypothetical protein